MPIKWQMEGKLMEVGYLWTMSEEEQQKTGNQEDSEGGKEIREEVEELKEQLGSIYF